MFRRIFIAAAFGIAGLAVAPFIAHAAGGEASCHATNGSSAYEFNGDLATQPAGDNEFRVFQYGAQFIGVDSADPQRIPADAKNDVDVQLHAFGGPMLYRVHSPDDIDFGVPYTDFLQGWEVEQGRLVFGRFVAAFDKRGVPDAHCTADTPVFTMVGNPECPPNAPGGVCEVTSGG